MSEQIVLANGVHLCVETFGSPSHPALLLIMGATASSARWETEFCLRLAARDRFVVRYDHRDTGRSVSCERGSPDYDLNDLVDDAADVLLAVGVESAHVVGLSLGGVVSQRLAIRYPTRVETLTLIASSPDGVELDGVDVMTEEIHAHISAAADVDWGDSEAAARFVTEQYRLCRGDSTRDYDEPRNRAVSEIEVQRADRPGSAFNHALIDVAELPGETLDRICVPTLVIHGTVDPVLPYEYGLASTEVIAGATLLTLEGAGHELHPDDWEAVIDAITAHSDNR